MIKYYQLKEVNMGKNLKFLSLGGNLISDATFEFPATLIALNLSFNSITDFQPLKPLLNLRFLNISNNLIENLPDISGIITLNELFISNNRLAAANFLFSIKNLCLLDLSNNNLESFEDLAMLSVSTRLHTLTLIGNPLYTKPGYKTSIPELFPRLIYLDPEDITIHSKYQQIGFCTEEKESSSHQKKDKKPEITLPLSNSFHNRSLNLSTDSTPMLVPSSQNQSFVSQKISTPKSVKNIEKKHNRSRSQVANGSLRTTPSLNNSCKISSHSRSRSIASKNHTATSKSKTFGNPVAAMMIGPPAVTNIFKVPQRQTKSVLIDISKMKVNKK